MSDAGRGAEGERCGRLLSFREAHGGWICAVHGRDPKRKSVFGRVRCMETGRPEVPYYATV